MNATLRGTEIDNETESDLLSRAGSDVDRARHQLDLLGIAAIHPARVHLEAAVARLHPLNASEESSREMRRTAERCRATLSSHLLAAEDLEAAGVPHPAIAQLLRRATDAFALAVEGATNICGGAGRQVSRR